MLDLNLNHSWHNMDDVTKNDKIAQNNFFNANGSIVDPQENFLVISFKSSC